MDRIHRVVASMLIVALSGCATIIHGSTQDIRVTSQPSGAVVRVNGMATTTPGVLKLERRGTYTLVFEKDGYQPVEVSLRRVASGWVFGNIVFGLVGLVIGLVVDFSNGAAYNLTPAEVNTVLEHMGPTAKDYRGKNNMVVFVDFDRLPQAVQKRLRDRNNARKIS